jgi:hypothetical protein
MFLVDAKSVRVTIVQHDRTAFDVGGRQKLFLELDLYGLIQRLQASAAIFGLYEPQVGANKHAVRGPQQLDSPDDIFALTIFELYRPFHVVSACSADAFLN